MTRLDLFFAPFQDLTWKYKVYAYDRNGKIVWSRAAETMLQVGKEHLVLSKLNDGAIAEFVRMSDGVPVSTFELDHWPKPNRTCATAEYKDSRKATSDDGMNGLPLTTAVKGKDAFLLRDQDTFRCIDPATSGNATELWRYPNEKTPSPCTSLGPKNSRVYEASAEAFSSLTSPTPSFGPSFAPPSESSSASSSAANGTTTSLLLFVRVQKQAKPPTCDQCDPADERCISPFSCLYFQELYPNDPTNNPCCDPISAICCLDNDNWEDSTGGAIFLFFFRHSLLTSCTS